MTASTAMYLPTAAALARVVAVAKRPPKRYADHLRAVHWTAEGVTAVDGAIAAWAGVIGDRETDWITIDVGDAEEVLGILTHRERHGYAPVRPVRVGSLFTVEAVDGPRQFGEKPVEFRVIAAALSRYEEVRVGIRLGPDETRALRAALPRTPRRKPGARLTHAVGLTVTTSDQFVVRWYDYAQSTLPVSETAIPTQGITRTGTGEPAEVLFDPEVLRFAMIGHGPIWTLGLRDEYSPASLTSRVLRSLAMVVRP